MEYMESMMNNRLEASISEYEQMTDRIKELESKLADAKKDQARYQYVIDWLESNVIATAILTPYIRTYGEPYLLKFLRIENHVLFAHQRMENEI